VLVHFREENLGEFVHVLRGRTRIEHGHEGERIHNVGMSRNLVVSEEIEWRERKEGRKEGRKQIYTERRTRERRNGAPK
jgi:hypothetical protein